MDITFISDTHGLHRELKLDGGTILMHAGDITEYGTIEEVEDFLLWFSRQDFDYKVFTAGNHDFYLQECSVSQKAKLLGKDVIYLQNAAVEIEGLKIWGSPVTPYFMGMAFNARSANEIKKVWDKIPADTDILLTHCPPKGILDNGIGCDELLTRVLLVKPHIHCFGHAHEQTGSLIHHKITFINAAITSQLNPNGSDDYYLFGEPRKIIVSNPR